MSTRVFKAERGRGVTNRDREYSEVGGPLYSKRGRTLGGKSIDSCFRCCQEVSEDPDQETRAWTNQVIKVPQESRTDCTIPPGFAELWGPQGKEEPEEVGRTECCSLGRLGCISGKEEPPLQSAHSGEEAKSRQGGVGWRRSRVGLGALSQTTTPPPSLVRMLESLVPLA